MRTFRMIEDKVDTKQKYFISFLFKYDKNPGFNLINNFINYFNGRDKIQFKDLKIFSSIIGLLKVILSKCLFGRLYVPPNENVDVSLDFEQTRLFNNSIQLSNELDSFGNKKANINWEILKKDYLKFQKIGENFVDKLNKDFIDSPINKATPENKNIKPYDVFHPVGTCMISSNENAIIDLDFKVRITENLFVINSGVIPSASIANPTFSLFCFSEYLVKKHFYNDY